MRLIGMLIILMLLHSPAQADCVTPAGQEGQMLYNSTYKTMQFCDGTNWYSMKGGVSHSLDALSCTDGQVAKWNNGGSLWECAGDATGGGGAGCSAGTISWSSCSDSVPAGEHLEVLNVYDSGSCMFHEWSGQASFQCKNGSWVSVNTGSCAPVC